MTNLLYVVLTLVVFFLVAVTRPTHARCPQGWWLPEGVRSSGVYECAPLPAARWVRTRRGGWRDDSPPATSAIESRVYCSNGTEPVVVDGVAVSCQRGGWR